MLSLRAMVVGCALATVACGPGEDTFEPGGTQQNAPRSAVAPEPSAPSLAPDNADGWVREAGSYALLGQPAPVFSARLDGGREITSSDLAGRWTVLGFWGLWSSESLADVRYMTALASAIGQDPDLDFRVIHVAPPPEASPEPYGGYGSLAEGLRDQGGAWETAEDASGEAARAYQLPLLPAYVLIGPDLTVHAWRGPLSSGGDDVVKSLMRGVAEIRRQALADHRSVANTGEPR
jgi:hypothetical protein